MDTVFIYDHHYNDPQDNNPLIVREGLRKNANPHSIKADSFPSIYEEVRQLSQKPITLLGWNSQETIR